MLAKKSDGEKLTTFILKKKDIEVLDFLKSHNFNQTMVIRMALKSLFDRCDLYSKNRKPNKFIKEFYGN